MANPDLLSAIIARRLRTQLYSNACQQRDFRSGVLDMGARVIDTLL